MGWGGVGCSRLKWGWGGMGGWGGWGLEWGGRGLGAVDGSVVGGVVGVV